MKLIHYGSSRFDRDRFTPIKNDKMSLINKPLGGLWTSPINSRYGWREYCLENEFNLNKLEESFCITLKETAKILIIDSAETLEEMPLIVDNFFDFIFATRPKVVINFEELAKQYEAIWLTLKGLREMDWVSPLNLYGWDCESILIMNPDCF